MRELSELQSCFANGLLDPAAELTKLFREEPRRAARRMALYRGNLTANWDRSLGAAYPVVKQLVGNEFFHALARDYGRATPNTTGDLNVFGRHLADFLTTFSPLVDYPYIPDVARLEWLLQRAQYAADSEPLDPLSLTRMDASAVESLRLGLRTGHYLFHSAWNVVDIWLGHQPGAELRQNDIDRPSWCLVCRPDWRAGLLPLSQGEFIALQLIDHTSLGEALESAYEAAPRFDPGSAFPRWVEAGIFAPCHPTQPIGET